MRMKIELEGSEGEEVTIANLVNKDYVSIDAGGGDVVLIERSKLQAALDALALVSAMA